MNNMLKRWEESSIFSKVFVTEGPMIIPEVHFKHFETEIEEFRGLLKTTLNKIKVSRPDVNLHDATSTQLLRYSNSPCQFSFSFGQPESDTDCNMKEMVKNRTIVSNLKAFKDYSRVDGIAPRINTLKYKDCYPHCINPDITDLKLLYKPCTMIFTIRMYQPFYDNRKNHNFRLMQEFRLLGSHRLTQLVDLIKCNHDYCGTTDVSSDLQHGYKASLTSAEARDKHPSSFFFIGDTFYCNARVLNALDLSVELRAWLKCNNVGDFQSTSMMHCLNSIQMQIGRPYVYLHLGQCEHVFVVSDIRMICADDVRELGILPRISASGRILPILCFLCQETNAKWLVKNCLRLTLVKCYLCQRCLHSYCYADGRKLSQFQVYKYVDPVVVL